MPPRHRTWIELLPRPWSLDPFIVYIQIPEEAKTYVKASRDGLYSFTTMELNGKEQGIQVLKPELKLYSEHAYTFSRAGIRIIDPLFIGKLSGIPQKYLAMEAHHMVFLRDEMDKRFMNLKAEFTPEGTLEERKLVWQ